MLKLLLGRPWSSLNTHSPEPLHQATLHYYYNENRDTEDLLNRYMLQETSRPARPEGMIAHMKERFAEVVMDSMLVLKRQ
jgi:hypothetical protein